MASQRKPYSELSKSGKYREKAIFIWDSILTHGDKYSYIKTDYIGSNESVIVTCPIHGDFNTKPKNHRNGSVCRKCFSAENPKPYIDTWKNKRDELYLRQLKKATTKYGDKFDYSKFIYKCNKTVSVIVCPKHGDINISMYQHIKSETGCQKCSNEKKKGVTSTLKKYSGVYRSYKYCYVYRTTNNINGKYYVGYHCTNKVDDGYIGCGVRSQSYANSAKKRGSKSPFVLAVCKYGYDNFTVNIIKEFQTPEEAILYEESLVDIDMVNDKITYNVCVGGIGGGFASLKTKPEEEESIITDYNNGMILRDMCSKHGISHTVIYRITDSNNLPRRIRYNKKQHGVTKN